MMQGLAVASGVVGAALPAVWSVVQPAVDPFSDEKDTPALPWYNQQLGLKHEFYHVLTSEMRV